jgi:hypothetical protein
VVAPAITVFEAAMRTSVDGQALDAAEDDLERHHEPCAELVVHEAAPARVVELSTAHSEDAEARRVEEVRRQRPGAKPPAHIPRQPLPPLDNAAHARPGDVPTDVVEVIKQKVKELDVVMSESMAVQADVMVANARASTSLRIVHVADMRYDAAESVYKKFLI